MEHTPSLAAALALPDAPPLAEGVSAPIKPHKLHASIPPRPEAFAVPFDGHDWTVSTHIFTAAFPRVREPDTRSKADQAEREGLRLSGRELNNAVKGVFARQRSAAEIDQLDTQTLELQEPLMIAVNRYVPKVCPAKGVPKVTLLFAHANGLHKETWEPTITHMLNTLKSKNARFEIEEIWSLDTIDQGDSAVLNAEYPGVTFSWDDAARDICHFVSRYLPETACTTTPPYELVFHPLAQRSTKRKIVGIGHSLGSASLASAVATMPSMFHSAIFVDTTMVPTTQPRYNHDKTGLTAGALVRRDRWTKGREEAADAFRRNKGFFGRWDPDVLDRYVQFALQDDDSVGPNAVSLKCRREQEAVVFADPGATRATYAFARLPLIPSSIQVHFVFAGDHPLVEEQYQPDLLAAVRQSSATASSIPGAGHLIPQEKPEALGRELAKVVARQLSLPLPPTIPNKSSKL